MLHQAESKFQAWRALAIFDDGTECLLFVGRSTTQVRAGYGAAYAELLTPEERSRVRRITMQCWQGAADQGHWVSKAEITIPLHREVKLVA
jgi:hypothetical protein